MRLLYRRPNSLDRAKLDEVIARYKPTAIMHFAAYAYVGESVTDPGRYYRNNVVGSLTLIEAARDYGLDQFVFSCTCSTYGIADQLPIRENTPQRPINPCGAPKLMVERMPRYSQLSEIICMAWGWYQDALAKRLATQPAVS